MVGEFQGVPCWAAASSGDYESWDWKQAGLRMGQTKLDYYTHWCTGEPECMQTGLARPQLGQVLAMSENHVRQYTCHSTLWQVQDLGLGAGLVGDCPARLQSLLVNARAGVDWAEHGCSIPWHVSWLGPNTC